MNKNISTIVMIPALGCDHRLFTHQIDALEQKGWRVLFIDSTKATTNEELAKYVLAKAPRKFDLMGLSMGGYAAFEIIKQAPHRVEKLIGVHCGKVRIFSQGVSRALSMLVAEGELLLD